LYDFCVFLSYEIVIVDGESFFISTTSTAHNNQPNINQKYRNNG
jgi:hypothetical protein